MRNFWLVAKHEYRKRVGKRSFLVGVLGFPVMILAVMSLSIYTAIGQGSSLPVGYVDHAGVLAAGIVPASEEGEDPVVMISFPNEESARAALEGEQIQGFYLLETNYLQSSQVTYFHWDSPPGGRTTTGIERYIRANLASGLPTEVHKRVVEGYELTLRSMDGRQEFSSQNFLALILPFFGGFIFVMAVMTTAGYMLQVVTDEKENQTMEMLLTSLSPEQLIGGKATGLIALAFTLMTTWLVTALLGLAVASRFVPQMEGVLIPWDFLLVAFLYFVPSFVLIAGMMTAIGGSVTEMRQGQQIAGMLNMLFMLPYFMTALVFANPNSPLIVALTLFPTTSLVTITLRWGMTVIPFWQLATSWILLVATAVFSVWVSARIFRVGMLMYGQGLNLKAAWNAIQAK